MKGGGGSGDLTVSHVRNFMTALQKKKAWLRFMSRWQIFTGENVKEQYAGGAVPGMTVEPEVPQSFLTVRQSLRTRP